MITATRRHSASRAPLAAPPAPLRVCTVGMDWFPEAPGNGLDRMVHGLTTHFADAQVVARTWVTGEPRQAERPGAVRAFARGSDALPARLWAARTRIGTDLQRGDYDVLACHFALYGWPLPDTNLPFVMHFHGPWALESDTEGDRSLRVRLKHALERRVYQRADRFIVLSEAFRTVLVRRYGVDSDRVHVVPGGVDTDRFHAGLPRAARAALGWPTDRPIVLTVRRLAHRMGLFTLLDAADRLRHTHPDVLVCIAGTGPLHDDLQQAIDERGLHDHVRLLGFVPDADLPRAYQAATLSVVPTTAWEGFGLTTVESLACGTPVFVTPVGGLPEVVRGLSPRLVLPDTSAGALHETLSQTLHGRLAVPDAATCASYAHDRFAWPQIAAATRHVYNTACSA
ncbi:MAG: glycosyltransferase family 4 protein [Longimonas sp.]|uniref:glycosyltransferase family 4 protein n=1 Tax=Longimonas sp. TaxID=2039626 RepID=UPI003976259D